MTTTYIKNDRFLEIAKDTVERLIGKRAIYNSPEEWTRAEEKAAEIKVYIEEYEKANKLK